MYQLNPEPLKAVDSWLEHYRQFWSVSLSNLKSFVESEYQKEMISGKTEKKLAIKTRSKRRNEAMKLNRFAVITVVLLSTLFAAAQSGGQNSFNTMKSLAGKWKGKSTMGGQVEVSYRMTSSGSALMSEIQTRMHGHDEDMISMIHMDGDRLLLTHYCSTGNQPRMQGSVSPDGKTVTFDFVDATNLASPEDGHMRRVIFTFMDANHHTEEWHFSDHGKETVANFDLEKVAGL